MFILRCSENRKICVWVCVCVCYSVLWGQCFGKTLFCNEGHCPLTTFCRSLGFVMTALFFTKDALASDTFWENNIWSISSVCASGIATLLGTFFGNNFSGGTFEELEWVRIVGQNWAQNLTGGSVQYWLRCRILGKLIEVKHTKK